MLSLINYNISEETMTIGLRGYSSRNIRILENVSIFKFYQNIHVHIAYYHGVKYYIGNRTPRVLISRFKHILYDYFDSCLIFKTPITQNSKTTCFANFVKR